MGLKNKDRDITRYIEAPKEREDFKKAMESPG